MAAVLDAIPSAAVLLAPDLTVLHANAKFGELVGRDDLQGLAFRTLIRAQPEAERFLDQCRRVLQPLPGALDIGFDEGPRTTMRCNGAALKVALEGGRPLLFTFSSQKEAVAPFTVLNEQIAGLTREIALRTKADADLRAAKADVERASEAKSHFLAAASHDLRQPTQALFLLWSALKNDNPAGVRPELVRNIDSSLEALGHLLDSILDISRYDARLVEVRRQRVAASELFEQINGQFLALATAKGITLKVVKSGAEIDSDPIILRRALQNIVDNAVKHTPNGKVVFGCRRRAGMLWFEVWDSGPGIPEHDRDRIFDEFVQLGNAHRDKVQGLGLGLSIVKRICALLDHHVKVCSEPGRGSCFAIGVPLAGAGREFG